MKPKISPDALEEMKFADYRKMLYKELKRMKNGAAPVEFIMMSEFVFSDFPKKKLPFLVIGKLPAPWKKYYKTTAKKRKPKDFSYGQCSFGADLGGGTFEFKMEVNNGKINTRGEKALEKVLLKKVKLKPVVVENLQEEEDTQDDTAARTTAAAASGTTATTAKIKKEDVDQIKEQAKALKTSIQSFKTNFKKIQNEVVNNLKKDRAGRKDLLAMNQLKESYLSFKGDYEAAHEQLKTKFTAAMKKLEGQNTNLAKLALAVKARKKSLAQQLADAFFKKKADRIATEDEIKTMQSSIKAAIDYRKIKDLSGDEKQLQLKAILATAKYKGPKFQPKHTDIVFKHLSGAA